MHWIILIIPKGEWSTNNTDTCAHAGLCVIHLLICCFLLLVFLQRFVQALLVTDTKWDSHCFAKINSNNIKQMNVCFLEIKKHILFGAA